MTTAFIDVQSLMERGPTNARAMFRYGSKPNQALLMKLTRDFLDAYAAAGNKAQQNEKLDVGALEKKAEAIKSELGDLLQSAGELSR